MNYPHEPRGLLPHTIDHNFCRNPDRDPKGPWCYVHSKAKKFDYCAQIPLCSTGISTENSKETTPTPSSRQTTLTTSTTLKTLPTSTIATGHTRKGVARIKCGSPFVKFRRDILRQVTDIGDRRWHPGTLRRNRRISGGTTLPSGALPWSASIRHGKISYGGTVISATLILTAGHCLVNNAVNDTIVKIGIVSFAGMEKMGHEAEVKQFIIHPDYVDSSPPRNDLALIKTKRMPFDMFKSPVCLGRRFSDLKVLDPGGRLSLTYLFRHRTFVSYLDGVRQSGMKSPIMYVLIRHVSKPFIGLRNIIIYGNLKLRWNTEWFRCWVLINVPVGFRTLSTLKPNSARDGKTAGRTPARATLVEHSSV